MSEWMPIETAPRDGSWIMLWRSSRQRMDDNLKYLESHGTSHIGKYQDNKWIAYPGEFNNFQPSYWQALPAPPTNPGGGE